MSDISVPIGKILVWLTAPIWIPMLIAIFSWRIAHEVMDWLDKNVP